MVNGHLGDNKQVLETKGGNGELRLYNFIHIKTGCKFKKGRLGRFLSQKMNQKSVWMGAISSNFWILTSCSGFCTKNETAKRVVGNNGLRWYISISTKPGPLGQTRQSPFLSRAHARKVQQTSLFHHADSRGMVSHCKIGNVNYLFGIEVFDTVGKWSHFCKHDFCCSESNLRKLALEDRNRPVSALGLLQGWLKISH